MGRVLTTQRLLSEEKKLRLSEYGGPPERKKNRSDKPPGTGPGDVGLFASKRRRKSESLAEFLIEEFIEAIDGVHPDDRYFVQGRPPLRRKPRVKGDQSLHHPTASVIAQEPPKDWIDFSGATQGVA